MHPDPDTTELLQQAGRGDTVATQLLFARFRRPLQRMVSVRMDPRLASRVDASDVVQEALLVASQRLQGFLEGPPMPFYPWLRQLTWERLVEMHRRHLGRQKRSVDREVRFQMRLPDRSATYLVDNLIASDTSPSLRVLRQEVRQRLRDVLQQLPETYRDVLVLRHLEQLSTQETAEVLGMTPSAVKTRYYRAIQHMHQILSSLHESE